MNIISASACYLNISIVVWIEPTATFYLRFKLIGNEGSKFYISLEPNL